MLALGAAAAISAAASAALPLLIHGSDGEEHNDAKNSQYDQISNNCRHGTPPSRHSDDESF